MLKWKIPAEENGPELPTRANEEFRPFVRRLPEFKFWYSISKSTLIALICTFFDCFNVPVFWPILVMYFITLFCITMKRQIKVRENINRVRLHTTRCGVIYFAAYDKISLPTVYARKTEISGARRYNRKGDRIQVTSVIDRLNKGSCVKWIFFIHNCARKDFSTLIVFHYFRLF